MWTIEEADGGARVLTDGHESVFITEDQEAALASAPAKVEFQDVLRTIFGTSELPFDDVDLDSIRDAATAAVSSRSPTAVAARPHTEGGR